MNYKHWEYEPETRTVFAPDIEDGITLATVEPYDDAEDIGRLIAAAPEMYKVLQVFADEPSEAEERVNELCTAYFEAREILARIDGKEEIAAHEGTN